MVYRGDSFHGHFHGGDGHQHRQCVAWAHRRQLGAGSDEATWVLTSYLVANAIVLPISGWLASVLGASGFT